VRAQIRRIFTYPDTGDLIGMDSRARTYPGLLAHPIRLRDHACRTPCCDAPIKHTDHITAHATDTERTLIDDEPSRHRHSAVEATGTLLPSIGSSHTMGGKMAAHDGPVGFDAEGMWDAVAGAWEARGEWHAGVTRKLTEAMVTALELGGDETLIELACGPTADIASAVRQQPGFTGTVRAGDLSQQMIDAAERRAVRDGLDISFQRLDVTALDLPDSSVDRVAARWIYMLLPDPGQGLREAHRVLRTGGRLVFAVFAAAAENPFFTLPGSVLAEHDLFQLPGPGQPSMFALADVGAAEHLVRDAGFTSCSSRDVPLTYRLADADDLWSMVSDFAGPISVAIRNQDQDIRATLRAEIEERAEAFRDGAGYALPGLARVLTAS